MLLTASFFHRSKAWSHLGSSAISQKRRNRKI